MTPNNFFPPEISQQLEELGCISEFDFHTCGVDQELHESVGTCYGNYKRAFHWSDLLIKENAIRVFGEEIEKTIIHPNSELSSRTRIFGWKFHIHHLLDLYNEGGDWQNYVKGFLKSK